MMDLDNFKSYNDTLGHPAGDALLHAVSTAISGAARATDVVYRYGGDEFALILPGVPEATAASIGERVRAAVARLTRGEASPVTISVGVAVLPADAPDKNGLIAAADTALYYGKRAGEDRLVLARDVPREMHDLRGTLDELARAALRSPGDTSVEQLVEHAALLSGAADSDGETIATRSSPSPAPSTDARPRPAATPTGSGASRSELRASSACRRSRSRASSSAARLHGLEVLGTAELSPIPSLRPAAEIIRWLGRSGPALRRAPLGRRRSPSPMPRRPRDRRASPPLPVRRTRRAARDRRPRLEGRDARRARPRGRRQHPASCSTPSQRPGRDRPRRGRRLTDATGSRC